MRVHQTTRRVGKRPSLAVLTVLAVAAGGLSSIIAADPALAQTTWSVDLQEAAAVSELDGVACPSATQCITVGAAEGAAVVATTSDGGASWKRQDPVPGSAGLSAVACASTADCWAVGAGGKSGASPLAGVVVATTDGGSQWTVQQAPTGTGALESVACTNNSDCWAVGQDVSGGVDINASTNGGLTWSAQVAPASVTSGELSGITCVGASDCWAVGAGAVIGTSDGGSSWSAETLPASANSGLYAITCTSTAACWAVGDGIVATTNGGTTWTTQLAAGGDDLLYGVSCKNSSDCLAVGLGGGLQDTLVLATTNGGSNWVPQSTPGTGPYTEFGSSLYGVTCVGGQTCWAVGAVVGSSIYPAGDILGSVDGGSTWSVKSMPTGLDVSSIACATASDCWLSGYENVDTPALLATTDGGQAWSQQSAPAGVTDVTGLTCTSASDCWAIAFGSG